MVNRSASFRQDNAFQPQLLTIEFSHKSIDQLNWVRILDFHLERNASWAVFAMSQTKS